MSRAVPRLKPTTIDLNTSHYTIHLLLRTETLTLIRPPFPPYTDRRIPASTSSLTSPPLSPPINPRYTWSPILPIPPGSGAVAIGVLTTPNDAYPKYEARKIWYVEDVSEVSALEKEMREMIEAEAKGYEEWKGAEVELKWEKGKQEGKMVERACVVVRGGWMRMRGRGRG